MKLLVGLPTTAFFNIKIIMNLKLHFFNTYILDKSYSELDDRACEVFMASSGVIT